ncbi:MAG: hemerythrin domain-containing protein [Candidatus Diapherotrites archaeon]|uniref:Hemerythrin domain-containing protein n=1 Tax=Candidatus Iainarchaeum sp. TaxID=3101447 RepID=A0A7J4L073_9ARCH|nr:hemerythrin domain-containing protein [Candidatus Diapherotrites archaeon]HIH21349.1 hypothetical protein [Candidatus Diapherotrites archaeon]HIH33006.1 hypothetical protein [Candidatus Diapherotrites archaeon]
MDWLKVMISEHSLILQTSNLLKVLAGKLESSRQVPEGFWKELGIVLDDFEAKLHHAKEEMVLFPKLKELHLQGDGELVEEFVKEHAEAKLLSRKIQEGSNEERLNALRQDSDLMLRHVRRENSFFSQAQTVLSDSEKQELFEGFQELEKKAFGSLGVLKGFSERVKALSEKASAL